MSNRRKFGYSYQITAMIDLAATNLFARHAQHIAVGDLFVLITAIAVGISFLIVGLYLHGTED